LNAHQGKYLVETKALESRIAELQASLLHAEAENLKDKHTEIEEKENKITTILDPFLSLRLELEDLNKKLTDIIVIRDAEIERLSTRIKDEDLINAKEKEILKIRYKSEEDSFLPLRLDLEKVNAESVTVIAIRDKEIKRMKKNFVEQDLVTKRERGVLMVENKKLEDLSFALQSNLEKVNAEFDTVIAIHDEEIENMKEKFVEQDLMIKRERGILVSENKTLEDSSLTLRLDLERVNAELVTVIATRDEMIENMKEKFAEQDLMTKREKDALIMENKTLEDSFLALKLVLEKVNSNLIFVTKTRDAEIESLKPKAEQDLIVKKDNLLHESEPSTTEITNELENKISKLQSSLINASECTESGNHGNYLNTFQATLVSQLEKEALEAEALAADLDMYLENVTKSKNMSNAQRTKEPQVSLNQIENENLKELRRETEKVITDNKELVDQILDLQLELSSLKLWTGTVEAEMAMLQQEVETPRSSCPINIHISDFLVTKSIGIKVLFAPGYDKLAQATEVQNLKSLFENHKVIVDKEKQTLEETEKASTSLESLIENNETKRQSQTLEIANLKNSIEALIITMKSSKDQSDMEIKCFETQFLDLSRELEILSTKSNLSDLRVLALNEDKLKMSAEITDLNSTALDIVRAHGLKISEWQKSVTGLEQDIRTRNIEIRNLKIQTKEHDFVLERDEETLISHNIALLNECTGLRGNLDEVTIEISKLQTNLTKLTNESLSATQVSDLNIKELESIKIQCANNEYMIEEEKRELLIENKLLLDQYLGLRTELDEVIGKNYVYVHINLYSERLMYSNIHENNGLHVYTRIYVCIYIFLNA
jgi:hypothetical protein